MKLRLGILDQSPIPEGSSMGDALRNSIDLAQAAEKLGYQRYWIAEHHGTPGLASSSPEILIGAVAGATSKIRVGSGGVMLPHYSPLKVAETFRMLSGLYPDRIDLGVGRAPGTSAAVARALQRDRRQMPPDDFQEQLQELLRYVPGGDPTPWLLGSSPQSAIWAAEMGLPYCFADFINPQGAALMEHYRQTFQPSDRLKEPMTAVAGWALCAETDDEALRLSFSFRMLMTMLIRGRLIPVPSVEKAREFLAEEGIPAEQLPAGRRIMTGAPGRVRAAIEELAAEYGTGEVLLVNIMYDHAARRRSYELIAKEFDIMN